MNWLKEKKINLMYVATSALMVIISYLVNTNFREDLPRKLSESLFWLTVPILVFSVINLLTRRRIFSSWAKMTNYFFILSVAIVLLVPTSTHGLDFVPIVKETATMFLATLYSIISAVLIISKSVQKG